MSKVYELIIIGSGPAGLAASIYASRAEIDTIVLEKNPMSGGQVINTYEVDNYPGLQGIGGFDLSMKFREHCEHLGGKFVTGEVKSFTIDGGEKVITMEDSTEYRAKAVIIATGAEARKLGVKGEAELSGMGVSYCATCDGAFFRNKVVAVVGGGDVAVEDAIFLSRLCKKVYIIHRRHEFRAAKTLVTKLTETDNIEIIWDTVVEEIQGNEVVESLMIQNVNSKEKQELPVSGIFIAVGYEPKTDMYKDVVELDDYGYIKADETTKTSADGIFAAGDIRTKQLKQIITAAADGANAVTSVEKYLI